MPYVPVPKDLTKVKTKVAFNLTKRQLICFGSGALVGIPTYIFTRGGIGNDAAALLMIVLMLPFFLFGIYEKDGQPLERILGHVLRIKFLYPAVRSYQTENFYAALERLNQREKEEEMLEKSTTVKTGKTAGGRKKAARNRESRGKERHSTHTGRKTHQR